MQAGRRARIESSSPVPWRSVREPRGRCGIGNPGQPLGVSLFHREIDDRVPVHHPEHLPRVIPGSHLTVYPGEGHMIVFQRAEEVPECAHELSDTGCPALRSMMRIGRR